ncbi:astakine-like [Chelonus insularis]|uniref:astakine-like n=1 Tax=Chelonus insularis TaxID=460826 RepID=UPI00158D4F8F|nr:astakine-like [Chelonus insularis]
MNLRGILVYLLFLGVFSVSALPKRGRRVSTTDPSSISECTHDNDCNNDECCVIGPIRYSVPQCKKLLERDEFCRPMSTPLFNVTLGYPDGSQIHLKKVHYIFCPCAQGLTCNRSDELCNGTNENNNQIDDFGN